MASIERHGNGPDPDDTVHIPAEVLDAFKDGPFDAEAFYEEMRKADGKLVLALEAVAERFRKAGPYSAEYKRGVLIGILATLKLIGLKESSERLDEQFELPPYIDALHTQDTPDVQG